VKTVTLYRPVGVAELRLIQTSGFQRFPPRLPEQPIFYPVCNEPYAVEIAERWNARDDAGGFVTRFAVREDHLAKYERHTVGARHHEEYWIPAEELDAFNDAIFGLIAIVGAFPPSGLSPEERTSWLVQFGHIFTWPSVVAPPEGGPYRCPCCRSLTLPERGGYDICAVCFWEDDGQDDSDADMVRGGPNYTLSLTEARANYARIGACEERVLPHVRAPRPEER
jgi:hypothetical protein